MSSKVTHGQDSTTNTATEGGRACQPPVSPARPFGPGWARKQRVFGSTGVITADLLGPNSSSS